MDDTNDGTASAENRQQSVSAQCSALHWAREILVAQDTRWVMVTAPGGHALERHWQDGTVDTHEALIDSIDAWVTLRYLRSAASPVSR